MIFKEGNMADTSITPYGYIYGKDPKAHHPFWGGSGPDIEEYVKSLNGTVTETEEGKIYTINATDGDDVVSKVIDILVPKQEDVGTYAENVTVTSQHENNQTTYTIKYTTSDDVEHTAGTVIVPDTPTIPEIPTDYVTSVVIGNTETATSDTYAFKYVTKDGVEHNMGSVFVSKDYVNSVSVTQTTASGVTTVTIDVDGTTYSFDVPTEYIKSMTIGDATASGVKTITITIDGTPYSFDVPVSYIKSITQASGSVNDDVFTVTDESGHTLTFSSPGEYVQNINVAAGSGSASLSQRKIVNGVASTQNAGTIRLTNSSGTHTIEIEDNAGNTISDSWKEGSSYTEYKQALVAGYGTYFVNHINSAYDCKYGRLALGWGSQTKNIPTFSQALFKESSSYSEAMSHSSSSFTMTQANFGGSSFTPNASYSGDTISYTAICEVFPSLINGRYYNDTAQLYSPTLDCLYIIDVYNETKTEHDYIPVLKSLSLNQNHYIITVI